MGADRLAAVAAFSYLHEAEFARTSVESEGARRSDRQHRLRTGTTLTPDGEFTLIV